MILGTQGLSSLSSILSSRIPEGLNLAVYLQGGHASILTIYMPEGHMLTAFVLSS